jgi:uncharacterized protein (TIGR02246 family)
MSVRDLYRSLLEAWNARDAAAFAGLFAEDGFMIGFDGSQSPGAEIEGHLGPIFRDHPTASYVAVVRDVRERGDVAVLRAAVGMVPPDADALNRDVNAVQSLVAERGEDGAWRIVLFQNTPAQYHGRPELTEAHTAAVERVRAAGEVVG